MSNLSVPAVECVEQVDNYGRFRAEPLEKGVGVTLGNSMRRALLAYLPGAAVTHVKIEGVQHEFAVIPGAREDVIEFLLNIKALRLKALSGRPGKLIIDVQGPGRITAADIKPSVDFEIANPELPLVTLNSAEARFYAELDVELGTGFKAAESGDDLAIGVIPVDAIFSPIRKVNFNIEPTHVGREVSQERLLLEVWTDGTISPDDAVSQSASILIEQLTPLVEYAKVSQMKAEERLIRMSIPDEKFNMPVEQLDLSVRTLNCLRRSGITTVGELISKDPKDLLKLRNFGQKSFHEIEERLKTIGLSLARHQEAEEAGEATEESEEAESRDTAGLPTMSSQ
ncbi:MAG: DNA-directed RNA polymerase subunit alpha [Chloroflexi bacterium]|nr:DNA-directed RNA polymerase subunit alpha [Chloroflexota bacterium]